VGVKVLRWLFPNRGTLLVKRTPLQLGMITLPREETTDDMLIEYFSKDPLGDLA
jgi:hypothetical protein